MPHCIYEQKSVRGMCNSIFLRVILWQTKQELDACFAILRDFEVMEGETAEKMAEDVNFAPVQSGPTRWHQQHRSSSSSHGNNDAPSTSTSSSMLSPETTFSVNLDLSHYKVGDVIAIYLLARTDQGWAFGGTGGSDSGRGGGIPAQTNIVNARTNPEWSHVHSDSMDGGSLVKGRLDWFSVPVTIEIGPRPGFFEGNEPVETSVRRLDEGYEQTEKSEVDMIAYSLRMAMAVLAVTLCCVFYREERDGTDVFSILSAHRRIDKEKISVDDFFQKEALELVAYT